ncbi:uncharacterized protein LOC117113471 [Anneissia japonica]|uniref:uncharacterized protein LOC117113471 n=1 Tax=Anneissia japonica TaxID=1529436 RepID=UPI0014254B08|nr:uncharacterized protein LOC117113471 [Anneissia japonica]
MERPMILGWDFLRSNGAVIDLQTGVIKIADTVTSFRTDRQVALHTCNVVLPRALVVPAGMEMTVDAKVSAPECISVPHGYEGVMEPDRNIPIICGRTVATVVNGIIPILLINPTRQDIELTRNMPLGQFYSACDRKEDEYYISEVVTSTPTLEPSSHLSFDIPSQSLTEEEKDRVHKLLADYHDIFSKSPRDYGRTELVRHTIDTGSVKPIRQRAYRTSPKMREEIRKQCQELVDNDIIERSYSPWSSPIVMVRKKDNTFRFCVDYRKINMHTVKDSHPLPRIDDTIDALAGNLYFSTMDLSSGYWQIKLGDPIQENKE